MANTTATTRKAVTRRASGASQGNVLQLARKIRGVDAHEGNLLEFTVGGESIWAVFPRSIDRAGVDKFIGYLNRLYPEQMGQRQTSRAA